MSMDRKRISEIQRRLNAATPRPWTYHAVKFRNHLSNAVKGAVRDKHGTEKKVVAHTGYGPGFPANDAKLIAHAPTDLADLLSEVGRLRARLNYNKYDWESCTACSQAEEDGYDMCGYHQGYHDRMTEDKQ